jgi:hypothetical protein
MEDVLDVYQRPADPRRPLVCMDEARTELRTPARAGLPARPRRPARADCEYVRRGTATLALFCAPLEGRRWVAVAERRTKIDWAHAIRELVDERYPDADRIVLVLDNLNIHSPGALYDAFPPAEAKRLADKLELHYTPVHGSWLNVAEIELSALQRQVLDQPFDGPAALAAAVAAWQDRRNAEASPVTWRFTTADARTKLARLYPAT